MLFLFHCEIIYTFSAVSSSVQSSHSVVSDSLRPHESQHARPPCPSPTPRVQTHIHRVSDAIQPSHPLSSPFPPGSNLEGMMLRLKLWYFGHLMRRVDSLEKTLLNATQFQYASQYYFSPVLIYFHMYQIISSSILIFSLGDLFPIVVQF